MTISLSSLVNPVATSGTPVAVKDEGVEITSGVTSFDFVGDNVKAVAAGGGVTVTVAEQVFVQVTAPTPVAGVPFLWFQTGLGTDGKGTTLWIEDGL